MQKGISNFNFDSEVMCEKSRSWKLLHLRGDESGIDAAAAALYLLIASIHQLILAAHYLCPLPPVQSGRVTRRNFALMH